VILRDFLMWRKDYNDNIKITCNFLT
jgi:hypothetical protein